MLPWAVWKDAPVRGRAVQPDVTAEQFAEVERDRGGADLMGRAMLQAAHKIRQSAPGSFLTTQSTVFSAIATFETSRLQRSDPTTS
jgi:hypothetical protein